MPLNHKLVPELFVEKKRFEHLELITYKDKGTLSRALCAKLGVPFGTPNYAIGYGHALSSGLPPFPYPGMVITATQAHDMVVSDLTYFAELIEPGIKADIDDYMFSGLVFFAANIGPSAFLRSQVLRLINEGKRSSYAKAMRRMTDWDNAGGQEMDGLFIRRCAEITLCFRGLIK